MTLVPSVQAQDETENAEAPSEFFLFWQDVKETFAVFFTWGNVNKAKRALDISEKKLEEYKIYRAQEEDKLAGRSLKRYQEEIDIALDILEKESDPEKAEQIAREVERKVSQDIAELEKLYQEAPEPLKKIISLVIVDLQKGYKISFGVMSGEYREEIQGFWGQAVSRFKRFTIKTYNKLWPF